MPLEAELLQVLPEMVLLLEAIMNMASETALLQVLPKVQQPLLLQPPMDRLLQIVL